MPWKETNNRLEKRFEMDGFSTIVSKLNKLATICDEYAHHPDFRVFGYKYIEFSLCNHDAGHKITQKDHALSREIDELFNDDCT